MEPTPTPRDAILDAASAEFAEHGFAGARVEKIAARAGVNKAMLYYRVGDKRQLYAAVIMRNFDRVDAALAQAEAEGSARQRLEALITGLATVVEEVPDHPRIVLREIASGGADLPPEVAGRFVHALSSVRSLLREGVASGEFRPLDPLLAHLTIVGSVIFLAATSPIRSRMTELLPDGALPKPTADVAEFLSTMLLDGLATTPKTGDS